MKRHLKFMDKSSEGGAGREEIKGGKRLDKGREETRSVDNSRMRDTRPRKKGTMDGTMDGT